MSSVSRTVTLRCRNHHRELADGLWNCLQAQHGLDYEVKLGERSVRAHWMVLQIFLSTGNSTHFSAVPKDSKLAADKDALPSDDLLESVLEFLYKGTLTLSEERLDDLQATAKQIDFRLLVDAIDESKLCEPMVSRVDEILSGAAPKKTVLSVRKRQRVDGKRPASKKPKLPRPEVDENSSERSRFDNFGVAELRSDESDRELNSDDESSTRAKTGSITKKPNSLRAHPASPRKPSSSVTNLGSGPRPSAKRRLTLYKCESCSFKTPNAAQLTYHKADSHDTNILNISCTKCDGKFGTEAEMQLHAKESHPKEFSCKLCDFKTGARTQFQLHMCKHTPTEAGLLKCRFCRRKFDSKESRDEHLTDHRTYRCSMCDYESLIYANLSRHRNTAHFVNARGNPISKLKCSECDFSTFLQDSFSRHMRQKHPASKDLEGKSRPKVYNCRQCVFKTESKKTLLSHQSNHEPAVSGSFKCKFCRAKFETEEACSGHVANHRTYKCTLCDFETPNSSRMSQHRMRTHRIDGKGNPVSKFKCSQCDYSTFSSPGFDRHMAQKHPASEDDRSSVKSSDDLGEPTAGHRKYKCDLCDFETDKGLQLTRHRASVHSIGGSGKAKTTYSCSQCKYKTTNRSKLGNHVVAVHSDSKSFNCPYCSYSTGWKFLVNRHINIKHLDMKPHACDVCDFRTPYPIMLKEHKFTHTGEKPFKCDVCDATFATVNSLRYHSKGHSADPRPHVCHTCGRAFKTTTHLRNHMKLVHKKDRK